MTKRKKKTADLNPDAIDKLAQDKPVVNQIINRHGTNIYTGVAKRGNVVGRIKDHLPGGRDPIPGGTKVKICRKPSLDQAGKSESIIIKRSKPRFNKKGK